MRTAAALEPVTELSAVAVEANRLDNALGEFEEHRRLRLGHFLTRDELAKVEAGTLASAVAMMPGLAQFGGRYVVSKRYAIPLRADYECGPANRGGLTQTTNMYKPDAAEKRQGIACACYAQVYMDGRLMNRGPPTPPFELRTVQVSQIEALEWYASPSQVPAQYAALGAPCGVLVLHTRRPP